MEDQQKLDPFLAKISKESHKRDKEMVIKFYNYEPTDKSFTKFDPVYFKQVKNIEQHYEKKINKLLKEYLVFDKDTMNLVPKKENADLKALLENKMKVLDEKYERAIREMMGNIYCEDIVDNMKKKLKDNTNDVEQNKVSS